MLLMIDNYDSFTYNLVQYLQELGEEVVVHRNDQITVDRDRGAASRGASSSPPAPARRTRPGFRWQLIQRLCRQDPDPRRLPRPPVHRPCLRRQGRPRRRS